MDTTNYYQDLDKNAEEIIYLLETCTDQELNYVQENTWSILGIAEHILLTEKIVLKLLSRPSEKKSEKEELFGAEKLKKIIVQFRARKLKAPDPLQPTGKIRSVQEFKIEFIKLRELLKTGINEGRIPINNNIYTHPYLGEMTVRDWLFFIPLHTKRHIDQISDLLASIKNENLFSSKNGN